MKEICVLRYVQSLKYGNIIIWVPQCVLCKEAISMLFPQCVLCKEAISMLLLLLLLLLFST